MNLECWHGNVSVGFTLASSGSVLRRSVGVADLHLGQLSGHACCYARFACRVCGRLLRMRQNVWPSASSCPRYESWDSGGRSGWDPGWSVRLRRGNNIIQSKCWRNRIYKGDGYRFSVGLPNYSATIYVDNGRLNYQTLLRCIPLPGGLVYMLGGHFVILCCKISNLGCSRASENALLYLLPVWK